MNSLSLTDLFMLVLQTTHVYIQKSWEEVRERLPPKEDDDDDDED